MFFQVMFPSMTTWESDDDDDDVCFLYSAILRSRADSLRSHVILHDGD